MNVKFSRVREVNRSDGKVQFAMIWPGLFRSDKTRIVIFKMMFAPISRICSTEWVWLTTDRLSRFVQRTELWLVFWKFDESWNNLSMVEGQLVGWYERSKLETMIKSVDAEIRKDRGKNSVSNIDDEETHWNSCLVHIRIICRVFCQTVRGPGNENDQFDHGFILINQSGLINKSITVDSLRLSTNQGNTDAKSYYPKDI
jgi:hypothetical protein